MIAITTTNKVIEITKDGTKMNVPINSVVIRKNNDKIDIYINDILGFQGEDISNIQIDGVTLTSANFDTLSRSLYKANSSDSDILI